MNKTSPLSPDTQSTKPTISSTIHLKPIFFQNSKNRPQLPPPPHPLHSPNGRLVSIQFGDELQLVARIQPAIRPFLRHVAQLICVREVVFEVIAFSTISQLFLRVVEGVAPKSIVVFWLFSQPYRLGWQFRRSEVEFFGEP